MRALLLLAACLAGCTDFSETVGAAAPVGTVWQLESVDDAPARAPFSLVFLASGDIRGEGPCNRFTARQTAPLPWFELRRFEIGARDCPDAEAEAAYVALLRGMDLAEAAGDTLLLTDPEGRSLLFRAAPPATS